MGRICMRVLSLLPDRVPLDNLNTINLRMPDTFVHVLILGVVRDVPEVAAAWTKAVCRLADSALIATFGTLPTSVQNVDFSKRRGEAMIQDRHEPGIMLVDRYVLDRGRPPQGYRAQRKRKALPPMRSVRRS